MDVNMIRKMVEVEGKSFSEVSRILGCNVGSVSAFAKRNNIKSSHMSKMATKKLPLKEIKAKYDSGVSLDRLKKDYDVAIPTLKRKLKKTYPDMEFRNMDEAKRPTLLNDKAAFIKEAQKFSFRQIANKLGVRANTVCMAAKRFGVESEFAFGNFDVTYDELKELYVDRGWLISKIAEHFNKSYSAVLNRLRHFGFAIRKQGGVIRPSKYYQLNDKDWLFDQYVNKQRSMADIADEVGTMLGNVSHHLKKHGIKARSKAEYTKLLLNRRSQSFNFKGLRLDTKLEKKFLKSMNLSPDSEILRNAEFESDGSVCFIDFLINGDYYEVKSREESEIPGVDRSRLIKQYLVAFKNDVIVKVWNGKFYDFELEDIDIYYCPNWKLIFNDPDACCDWLLDYGFKGVKFRKGVLTRAIKGCKAYKAKNGWSLNANYPNKPVVDFIKHFSQHFWSSHHKDYLPVSSVWEAGNTSVLRKALNNLWNRDREVNIHGLVSYIAKYFKDFTSVSVFKPWVARNIYEEFLPNGGVIVDPCMGWGGRFLATMDSDYRYVGYDLNPLCVDSHRDMRKFVGCRVKHNPEFIHGDSSKLSLVKGDLLFTSPPYDDTEFYCGLDSQCVSSEGIYENIMSFEGLVALNVPRRHSDLCMKIARNNKRRLIKTVDMKTASFMGRERTFEPIFIFGK